jgi:hypothetical protein
MMVKPGEGQLFSDYGSNQLFVAACGIEAAWAAAGLQLLLFWLVCRIDVA